MIQLICLNGEVFADHDAATHVPMDAYPAGCQVIPWRGSLSDLPFVEPTPPKGQDDTRRRRKAPVLTEPADLKAYAALTRHYRALAGVTLGKTHFATDPATERTIATKWPVFQADAKATIAWKAPGGFVLLDLAAFTAMAKAVAVYREACFAAEMKADAAITDGTLTTLAAIDALFAGLGA